MLRFKREGDPSAASDFFTELRSEADRTQERAFTSEQVAQAQEILTSRDELITLLARHDPASADRLSDIYFAYRNALRVNQ